MFDGKIYFHDHITWHHKSQSDCLRFLSWPYRWTIIFWVGLGNLLGDKFSFSPLACAWSGLLLRAKACEIRFFKVNRRAWIVEISCSNCIPHGFSGTNLFHQFLLFRIFLNFLRNCLPTPPPSLFRMNMIHPLPKNNWRQFGKLFS